MGYLTERTISDWQSHFDRHVREHTVVDGLEKRRQRLLPAIRAARALSPAVGTIDLLRRALVIARNLSRLVQQIDPNVITIEPIERVLQEFVDLEMQCVHAIRLWKTPGVKELFDAAKASDHSQRGQRPLMVIGFPQVSPKGRKVRLMPVWDHAFSEAMCPVLYATAVSSNIGPSKEGRATRLGQSQLAFNHKPLFDMLPIERLASGAIRFLNLLMITYAKEPHGPEDYDYDRVTEGLNALHAHLYFTANGNPWHNAAATEPPPPFLLRALHLAIREGPFRSQYEFARRLTKEGKSAGGHAKVHLSQYKDEGYFTDDWRPTEAGQKLAALHAAPTD